MSGRALFSRRFFSYPNRWSSRDCVTAPSPGSRPSSLPKSSQNSRSRTESCSRDSRALWAETILVLTDVSGKKVKFKIEMNKEHLYEDLYYDIQDGQDLLLYNRRGLLRRAHPMGSETGDQKV